MGRSEQMGRLPRPRPMVDTGKEATLPGKSERSRYKYLDSAVQSAAAHVENVSTHHQVQGMSRVAERTVRRRKGGLRLQRREATWGLPNLRARRFSGQGWETKCSEETQAPERWYFARRREGEHHEDVEERRRGASH